jgi:hypothetical protein
MLFETMYPQPTEDTSFMLKKLLSVVAFFALLTSAAFPQNIRQVALAGLSPSGTALFEVDSTGHLLSTGFGLMVTSSGGSVLQVVALGVDSFGVFHPIAINADGSLNVGSSGSGTTTISSGTSALGTSLITTAACATTVTTTATGVAATDAIIWNPNASIKAVTGYVPATTGGLSISGYPSSGAVNWDVCNWTSASITPAAVTLNWRVVR